MSETVFKRQKKETNYTILDNTFIKDTNLSWKAKGVMTYLLSLPDDWELHISELQNHATDGRESLQKVLRELVEKGYLIKEQTRNEKGVFQSNKFIIVEKPSTENQQLQNTNRLNTNNNNYEKTKEEKTYPKEAKELSNYLYSSCRQSDGHFDRTEKQLEKWTSDFDKIHRLDKREWGEIKSVLYWARNNKFWKSVILSASKFRDKYETLFSQMQNDNSRTVFIKNDVYNGEEW